MNGKLGELDDFAVRRQAVAAKYTAAFEHIEEMVIQEAVQYASHVYHQYTVRILNDKRDKLQEYLKLHGIPSMIYYPIPLYKQEAFATYHDGISHDATETLCKEVLSFPIHTEMEEEVQAYIIRTVIEYFKEI